MKIHFQISRDPFLCVYVCVCVRVCDVCIQVYIRIEIIREIISTEIEREREIDIRKKKKNYGSWEKCLRSGFPEPVEGRRDRCAGWPPDWDQ